jgi:hypothetical protein
MRGIAISEAFLFTQLTLFGWAAQAQETTRSGVSVGAGLESFIDGSVTDAAGQRLHDESADLELGLLANVGDIAFGAAAGWTPDIFGDGRLLVGGRAGWQPTFGTTRVQLLVESGIHRFTDVGGGLFWSSTPGVVSTQYVGARLGLTRALVDGARFEYGLALFVRQDLDQQTVLRSGGDFLGGPAPPPTELTVGGTMVGATLTLGFRLERARSID